MHFRWEKHIKSKLKEAVAAYTSAATEDSTGQVAKVLKIDQRSKRWVPRSGLQWSDVHNAVQAFVWNDAEVVEGDMPDNFTTTGLSVGVYHLQCHC